MDMFPGDGREGDAELKLEHVILVSFRLLLRDTPSWPKRVGDHDILVCSWVFLALTPLRGKEGEVLCPS